MGPEAFAQRPDPRQLLLNGGNFGPKACLQTHDRLIVEAAAVPPGGGAEPGMEIIRQVLEGEGLGHGNAGSIVETIMDPFWLHANGGRSLMTPRAPGVHTHEEWKGMAQPVGLVVEPVVLSRLGIFPETATTVMADWQQRLERLLKESEHPIGLLWNGVALRLTRSSRASQSVLSRVNPIGRRPTSLSADTVPPQRSCRSASWPFSEPRRRPSPPCASSNTAPIPGPGRR